MKLALFALIALAPLASLWAQGIERTAGLPTNDASAQLMMNLSNRVSNLDAQNRLQFDSLNAQLREIRTLLSASTTTVVTTTIPARISGTAATSPSVPFLTTTTISRLLPTCQPGQVVAMGANGTLTCVQHLPLCQPNQVIVYDAARNPTCGQQARSCVPNVGANCFNGNWAATGCQIACDGSCTVNCFMDSNPPGNTTW